MVGYRLYGYFLDMFVWIERLARGSCSQRETFFAFGQGVDFEFVVEHALSVEFDEECFEPVIEQGFQVLGTGFDCSFVCGGDLV